MSRSPTPHCPHAGAGPSRPLSRQTPAHTVVSFAGGLVLCELAFPSILAPVKLLHFFMVSEYRVLWIHEH